MLKFKGFGSTPQAKLIKGWLLPELQKHYTDEAYNMASLKTTINLWVGYFCQRKKDKHDCLERQVEMSTSSFALLCEIDSELCKLDEIGFKSLLTRLKNDNVFYKAFINKLYALVKVRVFARDITGLNVLIKESHDYKDWLIESGVVSAKIELINNWMHPLSETNEVIDGEKCVNTWTFASLTCAIATGRLEKGNKERAVAVLIAEGVLSPETWQTKLEVCRQIDAEYIQLINACHAVLEKNLEESFDE